MVDLPDENVEPPGKRGELPRSTPGATDDATEQAGDVRGARPGPAARLEERAGRLVAVSETSITDDDVRRLIDLVRR